MNDLIGKIVCGYKIISEVGEGGMGKVYLAESAFLTEYKQQVAIKTLTGNAANERQAALLRDLFTREANIQVQFKHPHIVSVIQFAVEDERYFLLLEYMPGYWHRSRRISNVADMIAYETGPIPHARALKLFVQALDAMQYAHGFRYRWEGEQRVGIVHRDIKPANLLLLDPDTIKVSDFGIVKVQQRAPGATRKLTPGTSAYMSPEAVLGPQQFGLSELDARSDIYALGITLYEMLAGRLPFAPDPDTNPDVSLRRKQVSEIPPPPSKFYPYIPKALDAVVMRALEKRPEARYQTAAEFKQAILALDGELTLRLSDAAPTIGLETNPFFPAPGSAPGPTPHSLPGSFPGSAPAGPTERLNAPPTAAPQVNAAQTAQPDWPLPARTGSASAPGERTDAPPRKSSRLPLVLSALALLLVVAAVAAYFVFARKPAPPGQTEVIVKPTPAPPATVPEGMVAIPAGSFLMGRNLTEAEKQITVGTGANQFKIFSYDWPAHPIEVAAFYLDKTEVSNRQYAEFVKATGHAPPAAKGWTGAEPPPNGELLPVTGVTYQDAADYCQWRGRQAKDGLTYRVPTEEEWEYAARGQDAGKPGKPRNLYPWGDDWRDGMAVTQESRLGYPRNVGSSTGSKSAFGIFDLAGNVAEWTSTDFNHYPGSTERTPREKGFAGTYQVVRGGGFAYPKEYAMTTTRVWARPEDKGDKLGFRCAAGK